jgi:hypothetical protein
MRCPSLEEIFDLVRGTTAPDHSDALRAHLTGCPACAASRGWLENLLAATEQGPLSEPPAAVLERAFDVMPPAPPAPARHPRRWSLAELVRETFAGPVPAGIRAGATAERRLLYTAGDTELDLEIARGDVGSSVYRISGQLMVRDGSEQPDVFAVLWSDGRTVARAAGDAMGMFVLRDVPRGTYRLEVWIPGEGHIIRMEPLSVGSRPAEPERS